MKYSTVLCALLGCVVFSAGAHAQEDVLRPGSGGAGPATASGGRSSSSTPISIGIDAGVNYNMFSQNMDFLEPNLPVYEVFESASGFSPFFDAYIDIGVANSVGVQVKVAYDMKNYSNTVNNDETCVIIDDFGIQGDTIATIKNEYEVTSSYLGLALLLRLNITNDLLFTVGPTLHFAAGDPEQTLTRTVLSPDSCFFNYGLPNQSKTVETTESVTNRVSPRIGVEAALGYKIPLSSSVALLPKVGFQFFLSNVAEEQEQENGEETDYNNQLHSAQLSIGLLFGL